MAKGTNILLPWQSQVSKLLPNMQLMESRITYGLYDDDWHSEILVAYLAGHSSNFHRDNVCLLGKGFQKHNKQQ